MRRLPMIVLILAVLALGGKYIYSVATRPDDKTQIQQALADAITASKEGRPGSVVDKLSDSFQVNGTRPGMSQIATYVKQNHPDIKVKDNDPIVSGDTAQITSDVGLTVNFLGSPQSYNFKDVQLLFKKETGTDWIIFPTTKWRLSATRIRPEDMPNVDVP